MVMYGWAGRQTGLAGVGGVHGHPLKPSYPEYLTGKDGNETDRKKTKRVAVDTVKRKAGRGSGCQAERWQIGRAHV